MIIGRAEEGRRAVRGRGEADWDLGLGTYLAGAVLRQSVVGEEPEAEADGGWRERQTLLVVLDCDRDVVVVFLLVCR